MCVCLGVCEAYVRELSCASSTTPMTKLGINIYIARVEVNDDFDDIDDDDGYIERYEGNKFFLKRY